MWLSRNGVARIRREMRSVSEARSLLGRPFDARTIASHEAETTPVFFATHFAKGPARKVSPVQLILIAAVKTLIARWDFRCTFPGIPQRV